MAKPIVLTGRLLDGKLVSSEKNKELKALINVLRNQEGVIPCLAVIVVGDNKASQTYVKRKTTQCLEVGIVPLTYELPVSTTEDKLIDCIKSLNSNTSVHGILVQLPLPEHISEISVIKAIDPKKDVDGFHPVNVGKLMVGDDTGFTPCTPLGIMELLQHYKISLDGKVCTVIGRSNIVGKPVAQLMLQHNCTTILCHSHTKDVAKYTKMSDIVISAVGRPMFVTRDMLRKQPVVIDVGINRHEDKLCGDVDYADCKNVCSYITPVPGGVGQMTVSMLLWNTYKAALRGDK